MLSLARLTLLWLVLFFAGCGSEVLSRLPSDQHREDFVRILVAASAQPAMEQSIAALRDSLKEDGTTLQIELVSGPSNGLARQILAGADADLFVSASPKWTDVIAERSREQAALMGNRLILAQHAESELSFDSLAGLANPSVGRIAIAAESVPVGDYARQAIAQLPALTQQAIKNKLVFAKDSSALLAWLENEVVDAAIIYRSDLSGRQGQLREAVAIKSDQHEPIVYTIAQLKAEPATENLLAEQLYRWLHSETGQAIFAYHGFEPRP